MGTTYGQRPSELLALRDVGLRLTVDVAVLTTCAAIERKLEERDKRGRPKHQLAMLLGVEGAQGFASLAGRARKVQG